MQRSCSLFQFDVISQKRLLVAAQLLQLLSHASFLSNFTTDPGELVKEGSLYQVHELKDGSSYYLLGSLYQVCLFALVFVND
jgi:hypothetical protein